MLAEDGKRRCLPILGPLAYGASTYADAGCTELLFFAGASCTPKYGFIQTPTCDGGEAAWTAYRITVSYAGAVYQRQGAGCVAIGAQPGAWRGTKLPTTDFVAADLKTE